MNGTINIHYRFYPVLISMLSFSTGVAQTGMICVPVADLVGQPMHEFYGHGVTKKRYQFLPISGIGTKPWQACPRLHQALLHEMVDIMQERNDEVYIKVNTVFYITKDSSKHTQLFWTLKSNVVPYKTIKNMPPDDAPSTTIVKPIYIPELNITLSAGTRCIMASQIEQQDRVCVYVFNAKKNRFNVVTIPMDVCMREVPSDQRARINLFVKTIRTWAHEKSGIIPYVWGGCSFIALYPDSEYTIETGAIRHGSTEKVYAYPAVKQTIKTGLDCSGLISRAAQVCNIPYYCKNSTTAAHILTALKKDEPLHPGDLLWFPGHLIVIADLDKHTLVEARSYDHGYGKVHEIPLAEQFEGINTYADLVYAYYNQISLKRRNKVGNIVKIIPHYAIYSLASIFKAPL